MHVQIEVEALDNGLDRPSELFPPVDYQGVSVPDFFLECVQNKVVIFMAKYFATRLHIAHGIAIALGLAASVWKPLPSVW